MTLEQVLIFSIVLAMMGLFVWGRLRYDLVAVLALLASVAVGVVPAEHAFSGFSNEIVVIVASALVVSAAIARSGLIEMLVRPAAPHLTTVRAQVVALVGAVTLLSAFIKNVGALAIFIPTAFQLARRTKTSPSCLLMPLAFGSLLGGLITLIGTSPNIIVARLRGELVGEPFHMFDFAPVGGAIALAGVTFLAFGYRLLPAARRGTASIDAAFNIEGYTTEVTVPEGSTLVGTTVGDLEAMSEGEVTVSAIVRERFRRYVPAPHWELYAGDVLILDGQPSALESVVARAKLRLVSDQAGQEHVAADDEVGVVEAVVTADSPLVERSAARAGLGERHGLSLLAIGRSGERITQRLRSIRFRPGDLLVLQGKLATLPDVLGELRCLPLAERNIGLGRSRRGVVLPVAVLALALVLVGLDLVPLAVGLFGASVMLILIGGLELREAYEAIDWPILILLGALIPVSEAVRTTGGTELIAGWLSAAAGDLPPRGALALVLVVAMALTPFLNNAATVLVMAPIGASLAGGLGLAPDPFLMAVAVGAACDFLTPIGHQCNTLVMGPRGYRFSDYPRLGLPLSGIVVIVAVAVIPVFWPLRPA